MEDFIIKLPCGLTSQYKEIFNNQEKLTCPFCKNHIISREECLTKNELLIKEKNFELKKKNFIEFIQGYRMTSNDPKGCIGKTYENLKNQIFQRREKVKLIIENRMDDYYENLLERIEKEKKQKLNDFNDDLEQTLSLEQDLNNLIINNVTDLNSKIEIIDNYCDRIDKEIQILNSENKLNSNDWIFNEGDDNTEIENLFGNLECKGTTDQNIEKEKKYDFILTIDKFSCFKNFENSEIKSNIFNLKNLEWEISVKMNENTLNEKTLGFYLACKSIYGSNGLSANVNAEFRLIHFSQRTKDFKCQIKNLFDMYNSSLGFPNFLTIKEIMDKKNGFYDMKNDSISLEITIFSADIFYSNLKSVIEKNVRGDVKWFNFKVGYGFLNWNNKKIFVHQNEIIKKNGSLQKKILLQGDKVEFDIVQDELGLKAVNVSYLNIQSTRVSKKNHRRQHRKKVKK